MNSVKLLKRSYTKLSVNTINPNVVKLEYAVRGPIVQRASQIEKDLKEGRSYPFDQVIKCNIGDCHAAGQKPISFIRHVLSVATYPELFTSPIIPEDAKSRADRFLKNSGGSVGAYSQSTGVQIVREDVAHYIEKRDGLAVDPENIFLSTGASEAVKSILQLVSTTRGGSERAGIMVPIPQYPLYSATIAELDAYQMGYYLDESKQWGLNVDEMEQILNSNKSNCIPKAIVVINPGNPTGQVLSKEDIENVLRFAHRHSLVVMADEVYQQNIYSPGRQFISFKRVLHDMGGSIANEVQLASFMSCSKGFMGECGLRGGYCELINFDPEVQAQLYKCLSARLCSSVIGQLALDVVVNPPQPGEPSYDSFEAEKQAVLTALKRKAKLVTTSLNALPGYSCNQITGSMYAFPQLKLPPKAISQAKSEGVAPDFFYCLKLLEETGVCVVPGSGFGQKQGTWHFRITILPSMEQMQIVMEKLKAFHSSFMNKYA